MARAIREALGLVATTPLSDMLIDSAASAAIAAMREPTGAMIEAVGRDGQRTLEEWRAMIEDWRTMIDAALAEGSDGDER